MLLLFRRYLLPRSRALLALVMVAHALAAMAALSLPTLNARIIDDGVAKGDSDTIWRLGGWMLALAAGQLLATGLAIVAGAWTAMKFGRDVRSALFHHTLGFSARETRRFGAPSLITRTTNDVQQVQTMVLMTLMLILGAPFMMAAGIIMAVSEDAGLAWLIGVAAAVLAVGIGLLMSRVAPLFARLQVMIDTLNRVVREQITGIRVVRAFVREPHERRRFDAANTDIAHTTTAVGRWMAALFPIVMGVANLSSVGVIWFGADRISAGELQVGQLIAFLNYLMQILMAVMISTMLLMIAPRAAVSARRITEVLTTGTSVEPPEVGVTTSSRGHVVLENVGFTYPGADDPVLADISLEILPGRTTAVIGSTGSGKTTLLSLIPRLFDATEGRVLVDDVDVREADPQDLWGRIGLVPQTPYLFSGTVASNLRFAHPDASDDELWHALRVAQAADFVEEMPEKLQAPIAQGGTNVSGGQRQRLAIARAVVRKPDIHLFDDSFSALDVATDARVRAALAAETRDAAVLIVAQRVSSIVHADEIIVLEAGRIVGRGTHETLLADNSVYQEIVQSQLSAEEAA